MPVAGLQVDPAALEALSEVERRQVLEELQVLEQAYKQNPLLGYQPHSKQQEFHRLPTPRSRLFIGGNRSGKTTATLVDTMIQCVDRELVPDHLLAYKRWDPPFYCRVVGPNLTRWLEGIALQQFREWCPRQQLFGSSFQRGFEKQQVMLRFKNESWIQFMSNDQDLDNFAGAALHRVVYDEPPREDIYGECRMRLIDYGGEELFGLTPTEGMSNWIHDKFYEPWEKLQQEELTAEDVERLLRFRLCLVDMDDNPHLTEEDKEWALAGVDEAQREARKTGRFVSFEGLIYPQFSSDFIVPDEDEIPEGVECFEGIDPGIRHMAAVVFCYLTADDKLVVYDELALKNKTVATVCEEIRQKRQKWGVEPRFTVIDPSVRNRSPQTGRSDQQEYHDNGIFTIPGQNDLRAGINRVKERLEAQDRLRIAASCVELRREFRKYRWASDSKRTENASPDRPVKKDDHLLDALRYVVMQRPLRPGRDKPREGESKYDRMLRQHLKRLRGLSKAADPGSGYGPGQFI